MRRRKPPATEVFIAGLVVLAVVLASSSCTKDDAECFAGDYQGCACPDGGWGYAPCDPRIDGFAACVCDGTTPGIDAGSDGPAPEDASTDASTTDCPADGGDAGAADAGPLKKYFERCITNAECETCLCAVFGGAGKCTKSCTSVDQCPAPADECTNRNVCRPPQ